MSKLLKESQIRRFMKLASIGNLSESFVGNLDEEDMDEGMGSAYGRDEMEEEMGDAYGRDEMMEEEEMEIEDDEAPPPMDDDEGMEADEGVESAAMDIISHIADKLSAEYDIDIDVSQDDDMGGDDMGDDDMGGDDDMDADMDADADMGDDMGGDDMGGDDMGDEEEILEDIDMVEEDELVAEVLKRVTARLRKTLAENKRRNRRR